MEKFIAIVLSLVCLTSFADRTANQDWCKRNFASIESLSDYFPWTVDSEGNNTAITVGSRSGDVGKFSVAIGESVKASGKNSFTLGEATEATGPSSFAIGNITEATGKYSFVAGSSAVASNDVSFVWQGHPRHLGKYGSHGMGTFNINPIGGLSGIWVGDMNMEDQIREEIKAAGFDIDPEVLQWLKDIQAIAGTTTGQVGLGTIITAILAALLWLQKNKVAKEDGKGLSEANFTDREKTKLSGIDGGAQANVIESISVNGVVQPISGKTAELTVSGGEGTEEATDAEIGTAGAPTVSDKMITPKKAPYAVAQGLIHEAQNKAETHVDLSTEQKRDIHTWLGVNQLVFTMQDGSVKTFNVVCHEVEE